MIYTAKETYIECIRHYFGADGNEALGKTSIDKASGGTLSEALAEFFKNELSGKPDPGVLPEADILKRFYRPAEQSFINYYEDPANSETLQKYAEIIFKTSDALKRASAIAALWSPDLNKNSEDIYSSWKLSKVEKNPDPYTPDEIIIQLNALYSPAEQTAPGGVSPDTAEAYNLYMQGSPEKIAVYDHPVPVFTRGAEHELEKCLAELDIDVLHEKEAGVFPSDKKLKVLISISTTHRNLDSICEMWLADILTELEIKNLDCYILSETKCRELDSIMGAAAKIFTVQGKYACHFGALKYAQLIFEKAYGTRAGFKLDTDEGIHSADMKSVSGKTWLQQLCHPYWGGKAVNAEGKNITLGFNIGEYVDSRDMDSLGYSKAIRTPEVKINNDLRGPYLLFSKGACQARGTELLNRAQQLEDFISHPLVKGGGYGVDNITLRTAVPVGFSMTGRAEDQQFYFSAVNSGVQGIFNPLLRIIHYKADVAKSEHKNEAARNIADIYRMLLFRELMTYLDIIDHTVPFPSNFASPLSEAQVFWLWLYLMFSASASGREDDAREYLTEGLRQLPPLLDDINAGRVTRLFEEERKAWTEFISAVDRMNQPDAEKWLEGLRLDF